MASPLVPKILDRIRYLKNPEMPHGYCYVTLSKRQRYVAAYYQLETHAYVLPELAVYNLLLMCDKWGLTPPPFAFDPTKHKVRAPVIPYPEADIIPSFVDVEAIKSYRDPKFKSGWRDVVRVSSKPGVNRFQCKTYINRVFHRTEVYETPVECIWALYQGKNIHRALQFEPSEFLKKADFGIIKQGVINLLSTGDGNYQHVLYSKGEYYGEFSVNGQSVHTKRYETPSAAAWAVYHYLKELPCVTSREDATAARTALVSNEKKAANARYEYGVAKYFAKDELANCSFEAARDRLNVRN